MGQALLESVKDFVKKRDGRNDRYDSLHAQKMRKLDALLGDVDSPRFVVAIMPEQIAELIAIEIHDRHALFANALDQDSANRALAAAREPGNPNHKPPMLLIKPHACPFALGRF